MKNSSEKFLIRSYLPRLPRSLTFVNTMCHLISLNLHFKHLEKAYMTYL